jgi:di/tripeptidase
MALLSEKFPKAQFLVTGLLGPNSNAHGPNEFMDIETAKKLTGCVAKIIADHHLNSK